MCWPRSQIRLQQMEVKNPRIETKGDIEIHGETSKKMSRRHKNSDRQTVDEINERQRKMETRRRDLLRNGLIKVDKVERRIVIISK